MTLHQLRDRSTAQHCIASPSAVYGNTAQQIRAWHSLSCDTTAQRSMVQCISREADLHKRQVVHVTEDYGDRLGVEGLQRPRNPPQPICQRPWGLKVPCHNM